MSDAAALWMHLAGRPLALREEHMRALAGIVESGLTGRGDALRAVLDARTTPSSRAAGHTAVLPIRGLIWNRADSTSLRILGGTSNEAIAREARRLSLDTSVDSILLDVDSPGGVVDGATEAAAALREARTRKPVVAVVNSDAGSAAYWLAAQASRLILTPSGSVGSIGVFGTHVDESAALGQLGLKVTIVSAGRYKTELSSHAPLADSARAYLQAEVDRHRDTFVRDVALGRRVSPVVVDGGFGQGRMVAAQQALREGMIDSIGTWSDGLLEASLGVYAHSQKVKAQIAEIRRLAQSLAPPSLVQAQIDLALLEIEELGRASRSRAQAVRDSLDYRYR